MLDNVYVKTLQRQTLAEFLEEHDFLVEILSNNIAKVTRMGELPVFLHLEDKNIYFQVDLGNVTEMECMELYRDLLDLNTVILPVSVGINSVTEGDPRLVLAESREITNLDYNEVLSVFDALEIAQDQVEAVLRKYI